MILMATGLFVRLSSLFHRVNELNLILQSLRLIYPLKTSPKEPLPAFCIQNQTTMKLHGLIALTNALLLQVVYLWISGLICSILLFLVRELNPFEYVL